jgi:DNA-binding response OmpR family regulator
VTYVKRGIKMENLKNYTILYAEDEGIIRLNISKRLKTYCKDVLTVKDGQEAWEVYRKEMPDVLILDINMPHLSGLEVAKKIREINSDIPILLLTAYTDTDMLLQAVELNLCKYLVKPVGKLALKEALVKISQKLYESKKEFLKLEENYIWDKVNNKLYKNQKKVELTPRETTLFSLLARHQQESVSHEEIMAIVWEDKFLDEISIDSVKNLMNVLRKKLPKKCIKSIYGSGYSLL